MNRRQRRAARRAGIALVQDPRIPVFGPENRCVALIPPRELRWYEGRPNAKLVKERRTGQVIRVQLTELSDDSGLIVHRGNPRRYSHDHETEQNPPRVWTIRRLAKDDTDADLFVRNVFRASVLDNLQEAA